MGFLSGIGKAVGGLLGGGGSGKQAQTTATAPWAEAQPYFKDIYKQAGNLFQQSRVPSADRLAGEQSLRSVAGGANLGGTQLQDLAMRTLRGDFLRPESNPYFASAMQSAIRPLTENFTQQVLPQLGSAAIAQGAYGGSRQGVAEALATQGLNRQIADMTSQMSMANYGQERQNQLLSPQLLQQGLALQLQPSQLYNQLADQQFAREWLPLQQFSNILTGSPFSTTTQSASGVSGSPLGGLAGLVNIGQGLFGGQGIWPNVFGG